MSILRISSSGQQAGKIKVDDDDDDDDAAAAAATHACRAASMIEVKILMAA